MLTALVVAAVGALAFCQPAEASARVVQCPDPTILIDHARGPGVTLMCTGYGFPTRAAESIRGLSGARPHSAFATGGWPRWADGGFWAPDLEHIGNRYVMYYSAKRKGDKRRCIGAAVSNRPDGGFRDSGAPLLEDEPDGAIDPVLLSVDGRLLLLYKRDGNAFSDPAIIYGRRLSANGLKVAGPKVTLLRSHPGGREAGVVEGPTAIHMGETTYLLFSEGSFASPSYAEGEAVRVGNPLGPYRRVGFPAVLQGSGRWVGTGGGSIVVDGARLLLAYNAFNQGERTVRRRLFIRPLQLVGGLLRPVGRAQEIPLRRR